MLNDRMMVQVKFLDPHSHDDFIAARTGELVNPFTFSNLGVDVEANADGTLDVAVLRSHGDMEVFRVNPAQVEELLPAVFRRGQWILVE